MDAKFQRALSCAALLAACACAPALAQTASQALRPLSIDDDYKRTDIPAQQPSTLTLQGAVQVAALHNRDVEAVKSEVSRFKFDTLAAITARLPNVRVLSYLSDQTVNSTLVPARPNAFLFMTALMPITQQYRIGLDTRIIKLQRQIAEEQLRKQVDEVRALVKGAYYKLVLDQSQLTDVREKIKYLNELRTTVQNQVKRGNALKLEEMQISAKLASAKVEETRTINACKIDQERLNLLLGRDISESINVDAIPAPDGVELNMHEAEEKALAQRPELRQAELRVKQIGLEKRVLLAEYIPNVSAGVVYVTLPGFNNQFVPKNILAPGIFINWNAFDWGRKAFLAAAKSKAAQAAIFRKQQTRDEILIDLHTQMNKLNESRELAQAAEVGRAAAREEMRVSLNRYKFTDSKLSDVLQAQANLSDANKNYHEALLAFWQAKADFDRAVGD